ncbi:MAG: hypothetical protein LZF62_50373 [Nitrospira sp.]|nr:MAG: hypothetical protein LZF62_50373 [Nitrospira sp.]
MPESYPYIISNNKIEPILTRLRSAAKPERFSIRGTLEKWGFTATNDRAIVAVLKELGFLNENGVPTEFYDRLRDPNDWKYVLGERMRDLYADLFAIDGAINAAAEDEIKGAISRVTGKDVESVKRYYATFKTLASLAIFEAKPVKKVKVDERPDEAGEKPKMVHPKGDSQEINRRADFHYNFQIHLPVTTDITVYNAIFKSLKDNLGI